MGSPPPSSTEQRLPGRAGTRLTVRLGVAGLVLLGTYVALVVSVAQVGLFGRLFWIAAAVFVGVAVWVRRDVHRLSVWMIVAVAAVLLAPGLFVHPLSSDDAYRYVWDGRIQLAGIDPYHFVPNDPALMRFRDPILFPPGTQPAINRPNVPTLYPPVAQLWFTFVALLTPVSWGTLGVQIGAWASAVATTGLLARYLGDRRGLALLYGASPAVLIETSNGAHLDALTALLVFGFAAAAVHRRHWLAGLFLGLAGGVKLVPLLLVPVLLRRGRWRTSVTAVTITLVGYVPHVLAVGALVIGFLPGYLQEEGYDGQRRFALLFFLPQDWKTPVALTIALTLAVIAWRRSGTEPVLVTCCWLYGCSFLVATPIYAWYALPFVVLVLMAQRLEWLAVWAASYVAFVFAQEEWAQAAGFLLALLIVLAASLRRRRQSPVSPPVLDD